VSAVRGAARQDDAGAGVDGAKAIMHHDSTNSLIMMPMRTTVTLEPDVEALLREEMRRRGGSFKDVLNDALRVGLRSRNRPDEAFEPLVFDMGEPRVDLTKAASLAEQLEDDELVGRLRRSR
jgi:CRISPR/Cas system-associated protein Csm6